MIKSKVVGIERKGKKIATCITILDQSNNSILDESQLHKS